MDSDDYSEEENYTKRKRQKKNLKSGRKKFKKVSQFFDDEAQSGDDQESVLSDQDPQIRQQRLEAQRIYSQRSNRYSHLLDKSPEQLAKKYQIAAQTIASKPNQDKDLGLRKRLPCVDDPKLWLVGCRPGKEKEAVINLMSKARAVQIEILSAFASSHVKDGIYIEAFKQVHVMNAVKGMGILYDNRMRLIPIQEMPDVFAMDKVKEFPIKIGSFVRCKSGYYKGDIAQVVSIDQNRNRATIKVIPRLEKTSNKKIKPPAKLFSTKDYPEAEKKRDQNSKEYYQWNKLAFYNGFLVKSVSIRMILTSNVNPTLAEISIFQAGKKDEPEEQPILQPKSVDFQKGDKIKIIRGDVKGITGTVISTNKENVSIIPHISQLCDKILDFSIQDVIKVFDNGDHVKVISGRYNGITGMVIHSKQNTSDILCDISKKVVTVLSNDLIISQEISSGLTSTQSFKIFDIVTLNNDHAFGIIVKVDNDCLRLIMDNGEARTVWSHQISKKYSSRRASAIDREENTLNVGDMVKIAVSSHSKYQSTGAVKNTLRGVLFISIYDYMTEKEIVPVKARFCTLLGAERQKNIINTRANELLGKAVRLISGPYKGMTGKVTKCMDRKAVVEFLSSNRMVTVDMEVLEILNQGENIHSMPDLRTPAHSPGYPMGTPAHDMTSPWRDTPGHDYSEWPRSPSIPSHFRQGK